MKRLKAFVVLFAIFAALLVGIAILPASAQAVASATGEVASTGQVVDWWSVIETLSTVVVVPLLVWLGTVYKSRRGVRLALKVIAGVIERLEPSDLQAEEKPIKAKILNEAVKTGQFTEINAEIDKAKGSS